MYRCPQCGLPVKPAGETEAYFQYVCWAECRPDLLKIMKPHMPYYFRQPVRFETRKGSPKGLAGEGIISDLILDNEDKYLISYAYTIGYGPCAGQQVESTVMCLEDELEAC